MQRLKIMGVAMLGAIWGTTAGAQDPATLVTFSIQPRTIGRALADLGEQAGLRVLVRTDDARAQQVLKEPIKGELTVRAALERVLADSGLTYDFLDERTVRVRVETDDKGAEAASGAGLDGFWNRFLLAQSSSAATYPADNEENAGQSAKGERKEVEKLEEIVVTAQKRTERLQDVPMSISVISGEKLDSSTFTEVAEALRFVPGVKVAVAADQYAGGQSFALRGVSNEGFILVSGAATNALYIDSVAYGFIRSSWYPAMTNVYDLERIEVLFGPQGTLYGAQSLSGVVRVLTHNAELDVFTTKGRTTVASTEGGGISYAGDATVNFPLIEGKLAGRLTAGYRYDAGWIDAPKLNRDDENTNKTKSVRLKLHAEPVDSLSADLSIWYVRGDSESSSYGDDEGKQMAIMDQPGTQYYTTYNLELQKELPGFSITSSTSYFNYTNSGILDAKVINLDLALETRSTARFFTEELNLTSNLDGPWRWSAGFFYRDSSERFYQQYISNVDRSFLGLRTDATDNSRSGALFGEVGRKIFRDDLELSVGLRYFRDQQSMHVNQPIPGVPSITPSDTFKGSFDAVTPRVVLNWLPRSNTTVYASYSEGFRSGLVQQPLTQELYSTYPPTEPDTLTNYEIGLKGTTHGGLFAYDLAVYYIDWQDIQASINVPADNNTVTQVLLNGVSASGLGSTINFSVEPSKGFTFGANATWNSLIYDENLYTTPSVGADPVIAAAKGGPIGMRHQFGGFVQYDFPLGKKLNGSIGLNGTFTPAQTTLSTGGSRGGDDATLLNARASIEAGDRWTLAAYVDNLMNTDGGVPTPIVPTLPDLSGWTPRWRPLTIGLQFEFHY